MSAREGVVYLAMPVMTYGTPTAALAERFLTEFKWTVENPSTPEHAAAYAERGMPHFEDVVRTCEAVAFLRFPDGSVGAGVAREIAVALEEGMDVFELAVVNDGDVRCVRTREMPDRVLSVDETRATIASIRERAAVDRAHAM